MQTLIDDSCRPSLSRTWMMPMKDTDDRIPVGTMLFDGDCGFCRKRVRRWKRATGEKILYEPYQKLLDHFPEVTEAQCRESVQLILGDRSVYSGAHAVLKALESAGKSVRLLRLYERFRFFRCLSEGVYRLVAKHRRLFSKSTALL
jgi:predicted DCC family thiol-disulfide oxidoreductase YuxK